MNRNEAAQKIVQVLWYGEDLLTSHRGYEFPDDIEIILDEGEIEQINSDTLQIVADAILDVIEEFISG